MSRIIDADALKAKCGEWYTEEGTEEGFIGTLGSLLDAAPTIDAIPLEWLNNKMLRPHATNGNPFGYVLAEWLEEQEAR